MSFEDNEFLEKLKGMNSEEAIEKLISIIKSADKWENRTKAIESLISYNDTSHFKEIQGIYSNESYSQAKIKLINLII